MPTNRPRWVRGQGWVTDAQNGMGAAVRAPSMPQAAPMAATPQAGVPQGIYGSNYGDYYGSGLKDMQTGLGATGSNPARPLVRAAQTGLGSRVLSQIAYGNSLEPQRQAAGNYLLSFMMPGREEAMIAREATRNRALASMANRDMDIRARSQGLGSGFTEGQYEGLLNEGNAATRGFARHIYSPEARSAQLQSILSMISALSADDLDRLTQGSGMIQQSNMMKDPSKGQALLGSIGNLAGMAVGGDWNPFARGGSQLMSGGGYYGTGGVSM